jgi:hypothetical protein
VKKKNDLFFIIEGWGCFVLRSMIFRVLLRFGNYVVIMDHMCVERVILIWMLLSATLGNSFFCTSQAKDLIFQNFSPSMFGVQPILWTLLEKKENKIAVDCFGKTNQNKGLIEK